MVRTKTPCWVLKKQPALCGWCFFWPCHLAHQTALCSVGDGFGVCGGGVGGVGLWFENCIVDASIFVVKFVRANGGCLGTRSR